MLIIIGAKSLIITTIVILKYLHGSKKKGEEDVNDNHINIINNVAPIKMDSDDDDITTTQRGDQMEQSTPSRAFSHIAVQPFSPGLQNVQCVPIQYGGMMLRSFGPTQ